MATYVTHGGDHQLEHLSALALEKGTVRWTVSRRVAPGDNVIFYLHSPISGFVAVGRVQTEPKLNHGLARWHGKYMADVTVGRMIEPPLSRTDAMKQLQDWGWLKTPRSDVRVPDAVENRLMAALSAKSRGRKDRSLTQGKVGTKTRKGGGFSVSHEESRKVEQAAIRRVWDWFKGEGWHVKDRQKDKCGYDLLCTKGNKVRRVEVKGVSGSEIQFIITRNEVEQARTDPSFLLSVVVEALSDDPWIHDFTRDQLLDDFELRPISYMASPKR